MYIKAGTFAWTKGMLGSEPLTVSVALGKASSEGGYIPTAEEVFPLYCNSFTLLTGLMTLSQPTLVKSVVRTELRAIPGECSNEWSRESSVTVVTRPRTRQVGDRDSIPRERQEVFLPSVSVGPFGVLSKGFQGVNVTNFVPRLRMRGDTTPLLRILDGVVMN